MFALFVFYTSLARKLLKKKHERTNEIQLQLDLNLFQTTNILLQQQQKLNEEILKDLL